MFSTLMSAFLLLGVVAALPGAILAMAEGIWPIAVMDLVVLAWVFAIWRLVRLPYSLRMVNFLAPPVLAAALPGAPQALAMHLQLQVDSSGQPVDAERVMRRRRADGGVVRPTSSFRSRKPPA